MLDRISAHEPPPAPIAAFIPYKPFAGNNFTPSQVCTLELFRPGVKFLDNWPLTITPLPRERAVPLAALLAVPLEAESFSTGPRPWSGNSSLGPLLMTLEPERPPVFDSVMEEDPEPAGPEPLELSAAEWTPGSRSFHGPAWTDPPVRLPDPARGLALGSSLKLCGPAQALMADVVEAFLPPAPEQEALPYPLAATATPQMALLAADWVILADLADPVAAPAAMPVEAFLPPPAEPQIFAWPTATALPQFTLAAADWVATVDIADSVAAPAAHAVEAFLPPPAEPQIVAWPAAITAPQFTLAAADWLATAEMAEPVTAPAAQAVEAFLPLPAEPQIVAWPAAAALPQFALAAADWVVTADMAEPVAAPAAQAVEAFLPLPAEPQIVAWPAAIALPELKLVAADNSDSSAAPVAKAPVDLAAAVAAPAAQAVETFLPPFAEPQIVAWPAATALPQFALAATDWVLEASMAEPLVLPAAQPVESFLPPFAEPCALPLAAATLRMPDWSLSAAAPEAVEEFVAPMVVADRSDVWMPSLPACAAERVVVPVFATELPLVAALAMPGALAGTFEQPAMRWAGDWRQSEQAEPVSSYLAPHLEPALPPALDVLAPNMAALQRTLETRLQSLAAPAAARLPEAIEPAPAEPQVNALSFEKQPVRLEKGLHFPTFGVQYAAAPFRQGDASAAEPATAGPNTRPAMPLDAAAVQRPATPAALLRCELPMAKAAKADFICQRTPMAPIRSFDPMAPRPVIYAPQFVVRPRFERVEEAIAPPQLVEKTPTFAEIFVISKSGRRYTASRSGLFSAGKLIAASLIVGLSMWFGFGSVKISRQMFSLNTTIRGIGSGASTNVGSISTPPAASFPSPRYSAPKSPDGPIATVRRAIQGRAAVELTDTFRRLEAWGSSAMTLPAGWSRHPDGYVHTGQLALFRPAQSFTDYSFEFFGEIEKKGMSWAVRAHDTQNYYAMKMTVIEPGLRPVIAVAHYAVVNGRKGQRVETPLSMMVHNHEPYHVAVNVKGNRVVTSIEGQEVDSWTDDLLKVGGVGFFSDAGESARLYWMRVSKNQDWLGRMCAYLSNGTGADTADLWRGGVPQAPGQPSGPALPPAQDAALAAAEDTEEFSQTGPQRARILKHGRSELCRS